MTWKTKKMESVQREAWKNKWNSDHLIQMPEKRLYNLPERITITGREC